MEIENFAYLVLLFVVGIVVIVFLFSKKYGQIKLKYAFPSILITAIILIICEIRFVAYGIKNFNPEYITGPLIQNLPVEVWIYYIIFPVGFLLIYEAVKLRWKFFETPNFFVIVSLVLIVVFALLAWLYRGKAYTFFTFFLSLVYFGYTVFRNNFRKHFTKFFPAFILSLIPFLIIELILTAIPVVSYDIQSCMGIWIFGVPFEDTGFFFLTFLMNVTIYEFFCEKRFF